MTAPRPDDATYESTISALAGALDRAAATPAGRLTDAALGVRLAQLIWNSEPDQALRDAASKNALRSQLLVVLAHRSDCQGAAGPTIA